MDAVSAEPSEAVKRPQQGDEIMAKTPTQHAKPPRLSPERGGTWTRSLAGLEPAVYLAAVLSTTAALIHLGAAPEHSEWWGYMSFFLAAGVSQGLFSVLLLRWPAGQLIPLAGIAGNLAIVLMYVVTRTWGMPLGPHAGEIEDVGLLDITATASEFALIIALVTLLRGAYRRATINALLFLGAVFWVIRISGILP